MASKKNSNNLEHLKDLVEKDEDFLKTIVRTTIEQIMESEMSEIVMATKGERSPKRISYRSGYYHRGLVTRVGRLDLAVPQDRNGLFSTVVFERYQRSEKALLAALVEMYIQGVSTRKVKSITEKLCGHSFSASSISSVVSKLDENLKKFSERELRDPYPYVILDARYEKVRESGVIRSQAVLIAIGVNSSGKKEVLGVEMALGENLASWKDFLLKLKTRGLRGARLFISDDHPGLKHGIAQIYPESLWQRCYVHFLRNALSYLSKKEDRECLEELRYIYTSKNRSEAKDGLKKWLENWKGKQSRLCDWAEENIEETFSYFQFPTPHQKHIRSTNLLERVNQEIKRRTEVIRIFPNSESCLRLVRALMVEIHEDWLEAQSYLNMILLEKNLKVIERNLPKAA